MSSTQLEQPAPTEEEVLRASGFTADEVTSLLWLRQWYQSGGSDRFSILVHWNFLRWLVASSKMEK